MEQTTASDSDVQTGDAYDRLLRDMRAAVMLALPSGCKHQPLLTTDVPSNLYDTFVSNLPRMIQQHHNCRACREFVNRYGGLVTVNDDGSTNAVMWSFACDSEFGDAVRAVRAIVERAPVRGVFITGDRTLGKPQTGPWKHLSVVLPVAYKHEHALRQPSEQAARHREEYAMLSRGLNEFDAATVDKAATLLMADTLFQSDKFVGVALWLQQLHRAKEQLRQRHFNNLLWRAVARAPEGWCHVKSTMIGTLLEDLESGMAFEDVKKRFYDKVRPDSYQRPKAAPTEGNVKRAEEIVAKLGLADALKRRFARLDEVTTLWRPPAKTKDNGPGVFGHLRTKGQKDSQVTLVRQAARITWEKFVATVLPKAERIVVDCPSHGAYIGILTEEVAGSAKLFKWDHSFSHYLYVNGSSASRWGVRSGWNEVTAVTCVPSEWGNLPGTRPVLLLENCVDEFAEHSMLFPENLRSELHEVRATIEAFSASRAVSGKESASACGIELKYMAGTLVRVTAGDVTLTYYIDRLN